jgi:curved DNA-binding protein CbpA
MILPKLLSFLALVTFAFAYFSPKQLEIIDLHYKIQPKHSNSRDNEIRTFYSILSVPQNVNDDKLEKAYKKLSRKWHPDKFINKDTKERLKAERKFETLSIIISILRDVERRKNYDYFLKKGFPIWDKSKSRYVFKNRSKPTFTLTIGFILLISSIGQLIIKKLNKSQKNKRIEKILRDVRWKADNMTKQDQMNNKIMELPDNFEMNNTLSNYSVDDKLVTYCGKIFIVKPDRSVLLYDDDSIDVENQQEMNDLVKKIVESGHFNLYGFQKKQLNRKERRQVEKENKNNQSDDEQNDIIEKLVQFKEDDSSLKFSDLYLAKMFIISWNTTLGKLILKSKQTGELEDDNNNDNAYNNTTVAKELEKIEEFESIDTSKTKDGKIILKNGKVLHSRKK